MLKLVEMDEKVDDFLSAWADDAAYLKSQPGFISTQLHRGIGGSSVFINYAVWESTELYKGAFNNPEFQSHVEKYQPSIDNNKTRVDVSWNMFHGI